MKQCHNPLSFKFLCWLWVNYKSHYSLPRGPWLFIPICVWSYLLLCVVSDTAGTISLSFCNLHLDPCPYFFFPMVNSHHHRNSTIYSEITRWVQAHATSSFSLSSSEKGVSSLCTRTSLIWKFLILDAFLILVIHLSAICSEPCRIEL